MVHSACSFRHVNRETDSQNDLLKQKWTHYDVITLILIVVAFKLNLLRSKISQPTFKQGFFIETWVFRSLFLIKHMRTDRLHWPIQTLILEYLREDACEFVWGIDSVWLLNGRMFQLFWGKLRKSYQPTFVKCETQSANHTTVLDLTFSTDAAVYWRYFDCHIHQMRSQIITISEHFIRFPIHFFVSHFRPAVFLNVRNYLLFDS